MRRFRDRKSLAFSLALPAADWTMADLVRKGRYADEIMAPRDWAACCAFPQLGGLHHRYERRAA